MQVTMRYHLIPTHFEKKQRKKEKNKQGCGEIGTCDHGVGGNVKWCKYMENSMEFPQKIKNRITI